MLHPTPHEYARQEPIVEMRGVTCGYDGSPVLSSVDLTINRGDFVGLLGPISCKNAFMVAARWTCSRARYGSKVSPSTARGRA